MEASNCSMNPSASEMRDSQHSSDMVERVARALCEPNFKQQGAEGEFGTVDDSWWAWRDEARAALEASHHAELVEAIRWTVEQIELCAKQAGAPPRQSMIYLRLTGLLAKIGGDA